MIKKIAIFVEGKTERIFFDKFLREFALTRKISIESVDASGGGSCPRFTTLIAKDTIKPETEFEILLFNSCTDNRVISDLKENYASLKSNGYNAFIALRDLFPDYRYQEKNEAIEDVSPFISNLENTTVIFVTMEIETWFIAELYHYPRIDENLTIDYIKNNKIDLENINFEMDIAKPAKILGEIYQLQGKSWNKKESNINRTINSLDYENLFSAVKNKIPSLNQLIIKLDDFFSYNNTQI
jgi:acylphosphatase